MEYFCEVVHNATHSLSDHHPSLIGIALLPLERNGYKKSSYMKLDALELFVESTCISLEKVWDEQMIEGRDPRVNYELGWKAIWNEVKKNGKARVEAEKN